MAPFEVVTYNDGPILGFANAIKNGIREHDDSVSGQTRGVKGYCMNCTFVTMMLDGLATKHQLKLHNWKPAP